MSENASSQTGKDALLWTVLGSVARAGAQFVVGLVLARLLGPQPFGIVALAWLAIGLANLFADLGLSAAIVQRPELVDQDVRFVTFAQVLLGAVLTLSGLLLATPIAAALGNQAAAPCLRALSLIFVVQSLGQTATALLKRELRFKAIYVTYIGSYLFGYVLLGIPLALLGAREWSLVAAQLAQAAVSALVSNMTLKRVPAMALRPATTGFGAFGAKVSVANVINWGLINVDNIIVSRAFGSASLGLYSRISSLTMAVPNAVAPNLQSLTFASGARAMRQGGSAASSLGQFSFLVALPIGFLTAVFCADPQTVVQILYGPKWSAAWVFLPPLALASLGFSLMALVGPILTAEDRVGAEIWAQAVCLLATVAALSWAAPLGYLRFTWCVAAMYWLRYLVLLAALKMSSALRLASLLTSLRLPALSAAGAYLACATVHGVLKDGQAFSRLLAEGASVSATYGALAFVFRGDLGSLPLARRAADGLARSMALFGAR